MFQDSSSRGCESFILNSAPTKTEAERKKEKKKLIGVARVQLKGAREEGRDDLQFCTVGQDNKSKWFQKAATVVVRRSGCGGERLVPDTKKDSGKTRLGIRLSRALSCAIIITRP